MLTHCNPRVVVIQASAKHVVIFKIIMIPVCLAAVSDGERIHGVGNLFHTFRIAILIVVQVLSDLLGMHHG